MNQTDKPSLADIARKNNSARTSKFASSMVPAAPQMTPAVEEVKDTLLPEQPASPLAEVITKAEDDFASGRGRSLTTEELQTMETDLAVQPDAPQSDVAKPVAVVTDTTGATRNTRRRSAGVNMSDDILLPKAPEEEAFGKMTRIAEKHHDLLRKIAYEHRKPMNTILYNLLELLDQTYQRDQQKDV